MKKIIFALLLIPLTVTAGDTFTWLPVTKDIAGNTTTIKNYHLNCGTAPGARTITKAVGNITETKINTVVTADGTYYCALQAENADGKSGESPELRFFLKAGDARLLVPAAPESFGIK